jgi:hypothetical protein
MRMTVPEAMPYIEWLAGGDDGIIKEQVSPCCQSNISLLLSLCDCRSETGLPD